MTTWLHTVLDRGLVPFATLAGVGLTLYFNGRREGRKLDHEAAQSKVKADRERAQRFNDRRAELYVDASKHMQDWQAESRMIADESIDDPFTEGNLTPLIRRTGELSGPIGILGPTSFDPLWADFLKAANHANTVFASCPARHPRTAHQACVRAARDAANAVDTAATVFRRELRAEMARLENA